MDTFPRFVLSGGFAAAWRAAKWFSGGGRWQRGRAQRTRCAV